MELKSRTTLSALLAVAITVFIVIFPEPSFKAALNGLKIWWEIVFPALLPFFIMAELLMGLGVVPFMGTLLEPLMQPLFKVPGVGAFAMAMGLASGYPIGAKITGNLRRKELCSRVEGERLVSFTNTADPLFMVGAVAVGMFGNPRLGIVLALAHYISTLIVGVVLRFYRGGEEQEKFVKEKNNQGIFRLAFANMMSARKEDGRAFGELIGNAITDSINTLLLIGGFIMLFSVITQVISSLGLLSFLATVLGAPLHFFKISPEILCPFVSGFFEITNGTEAASRIAAPLLQQAMAASAIIAWSGLSVHAQVATMLNGTDLRLKPYIWARALHAVLAAAVTYPLMLLMTIETQETISLLVPWQNLSYMGFLDRIILSGRNLLVILALLLSVSLLIYLLEKIKVVIFFFRE
ncbi:MAG: sporulation integral membrane protein YlbJ [Halanaerobium sp.]|nr:sporulation integral membrane protein YlbJ [Halanaerobium sp.]